MINNSFGQQIKSARLKMGLNQSELASHVGISRNYLSQIERGESTNLSWQVKTDLTDFLGISTTEESTDIPFTLTEFAKKYEVPPDDIRMLSNLEYRGQRPKTVEQWRILYKVIQSVIMED